ncbi:endolytic transglycosylase MltG [Cellulomonas fimi]|uniref:Endolytic murein transglycosylase n=1 Tax=Cellulomonas fimi (strain ATCC 484 / DSM 20113 / JCM 1341 / CCUG 24087 / LMG 16345 / NBRC 15513 / NCIMB 8980 / NCTC 7547 / NRS-133) TaxID=590998 RepID=F4H092_CELFA|nr:endolytic transglycosylase MltG [Cellulomonas fimi]AEE46139.1 aminodeoxychorismate lyase [Cellulomonas fimi ATCC 484]NNH07074.1 endolytic transglycosylase MltG [Cellulomonas fimi]VEH31785.1 putative aminodeoxychorismate lyase [Cellulomonas fimi]
MSNSQTEWWAPVERGDQVSDLFGGDPSARRGAPAPESRRSRQRGKAKAERERKRRRRRSFGVLVVALVLFGGAAYVVSELMGGFFGGGQAESVEDYPGPGSGTAEITIEAGDAGGVIGQKLVDAGVIASVKPFTAAWTAEPQANSIQPGTYRLLQEMRAADALAALLAPSSRASFRLTIPEGLNAEQIYTKINEKTVTITVDQLRAAAADPAAIGLPAEAGGKIEGWLFPTTYDIPPDATATSVLQMMVAKMVEVLTAKGVPQDQWQTVLTKASIVEREGKLPEDRAKVARGIQNRLDQEMRLQVDATTSYGLGVTRAPTSAENQDPNNPYSTYVRIGLPPGPIASPGDVSLEAVLHPADGPWLFWVTVNPETGETLFTDDFAEHNANIKKLNDWLAEHGSE